MTNGELFKICPHCHARRPIAELSCGNYVDGLPCGWGIAKQAIHEPESSHQNPGEKKPAAAAIGCLIAGWKVAEELQTTVGNQQHFVVSRLSEPALFLLTLYKAGSEPSPAIYEVLGKFSGDHVPGLHETGYWQGQAYEVRELLSGGSVKTLQIDGTDLLTVERFVSELGQILSNFSDAGLRHRNIRPETILIRSREPLNLVVSGFGSARLSDLDLEISAPIEISRYTAPETVLGGISVASDWWGLGMVLLDKVTNGRCFAEADDQLFMIHVISNGVTVPEGLPPRLKTLLRGLLTVDRTRRWNWKQVQLWLRGEDVPVSQAVPIEASPSSGPSIRFGGKDYFSVLQFSLAAARASTWSEACDLLERGAIAGWVRELDPGSRVLSALEQLTTRTDISPDFRLAVGLTLLNPALPVICKETIVSPAWLLENPESGFALLSGPVPELLWRFGLQSQAWLLQLSRRLESVRRRAESLSIRLDERQFQLCSVVSSRVQLSAIWAERRQMFPEANLPALSSIIDHRSYSEEDLLLLSSAAACQFRPVGEVIAETLRLAGKNSLAPPEPELLHSLLRQPRFQLYQTLERRTEGFARCEIAMIDEWVDNFRIRRRLEVEQLLLVLAIREGEWIKPPHRDYISSLLKHFENKVSASVLRGPLVRMTIGKTTPRIDIMELGLNPEDASRILEHILEKSDRQCVVSPKIFENELNPENRLRRLENHSAAYQRDTGVNGLYLGFPFVVLNDQPTKRQARLAPVLLWPVKLKSSVGQRDQFSVTFDSVREEIRLNPALDGMLGNERARDWREAANSLMMQTSIRLSSALDAFGLLATVADRVLVPVPSKSVVEKISHNTLVPAAVLFHVEFIGQSLMEDLRLLPQQTIEGTALETMLRIGSEPSVAAQVHPNALRYMVAASDPSQENAIAQAFGDKGVVIQGPPGTGKSQTIVNLVADAIGQHKSVLVVCQKLPALDVVRKRLEAHGLQDRFCMVTNVNGDREAILLDIREQIGQLTSGGRTNHAGLPQRRSDLQQKIQAIEEEVNGIFLAGQRQDTSCGRSYASIIDELLSIELEHGADIPDLIGIRRLLTQSSAVSLERLEESCADVGTLWLNSNFERSPYRDVQDLAYDDASILEFRTSLESLHSAMVTHEQILKETTGEIDVENPDSAQKWVNDNEVFFKSFSEEDFNNLLEKVACFSDASQGGQLIHSIRDLTELYRSSNYACEDVPTLRAILTSCPEDRLREYAEYCGQISAHWLDSGFNDSPLRQMKDEAFDTASIAAFRDRLQHLATVEKQRQALLKQPFRGKDLADTSTLERWLDQYGEMLRDIDEEKVGRIRALCSLFKSAPNKSSRGELLLTKARAFSDRLTNLDLCDYSESIGRLVCQIPVLELASWQNAAEQLVRRTSPIDQEEIDEALVVEFGSSIEKLNASLPNEDFGDVVEEIECFRSSTEGSHMIQQLRVVKESYKSNKQACEEVAALRMLLSRCPEDRLRESAKYCGRISLHWLQSEFSDSPFRQMKDEAFDGASIAAFRNSLQYLATVEEKRQEVLQHPFSENELASTSELEQWLEQYGEMLRSIGAERASRIRDLYSLYETPLNRPSRGELLLSQLRGFSSRLARLELSGYSESIGRLVCQIPAAELVSWQNAAEYLVKRRSVDDHQEIDEATIVEFSSCLESLPASLPVRNFSDALDQIESFRNTRDGGQFIQTLRDLQQLYRSNKQACEDVVPLRSLLSSCPEDRLREYAECCSQISTHWLDSRFNGGPLSQLKDHAFESASIVAFRDCLQRLATAEMQRQAVLQQPFSGKDLASTSEIEQWLEQFGEKLRNINAETATRIRDQYRLFEAPPGRPSRGESLLTKARDFSSRLMSLDLSHYSESIGRLVCQIPAADLASWQSAAEYFFKDPSLLDQFNPARLLAIRGLRHLLSKSSIPPNSTNIKSFGKALLLERQVIDIRQDWQTLPSRNDNQHAEVMTLTELQERIEIVIHDLEVTRQAFTSLKTFPLRIRIDVEKLHHPNSFHNLVRIATSLVRRSRARIHSLEAIEAIRPWMSDGWCEKTVEIVSKCTPTPVTEVCPLRALCECIPVLDSLIEFRNKLSSAAPIVARIFEELSSIQGRIRDLARTCPVFQVVKTCVLHNGLSDRIDRLKRNNPSLMSYFTGTEEEVASSLISLDQLERAAKISRNAGSASLLARWRARQFLIQSAITPNVSNLESFGEALKLEFQVNDIREYLQTDAATCVTKLPRSCSLRELLVFVNSAISDLQKTERVVNALKACPLKTSIATDQLDSPQSFHSLRQLAELSLRRARIRADSLGAIDALRVWMSDKWCEQAAEKISGMAAETTDDHSSFSHLIKSLSTLDAFLAFRADLRETGSIILTIFESLSPVRERIRTLAQSSSPCSVVETYILFNGAAHQIAEAKRTMPAVARFPTSTEEDVSSSLRSLELLQHAAMISGTPGAARLLSLWRARSLLGQSSYALNSANTQSLGKALLLELEVIDIRRDCASLVSENTNEPLSLLSLTEVRERLKAAKDDLEATHRAVRALETCPLETSLPPERLINPVSFRNLRELAELLLRRAHARSECLDAIEAVRVWMSDKWCEQAAEKVSEMVINDESRQCPVETLTCALPTVESFVAFRNALRQSETVVLRIFEALFPFREHIKQLIDSYSPEKIVRTYVRFNGLTHQIERAKRRMPAIAHLSTSTATELASTLRLLERHEDIAQRLKSCPFDGTQHVNLVTDGNLTANFFTKMREAIRRGQALWRCRTALNEFSTWISSGWRARLSEYLESGVPGSELTQELKDALPSLRDFLVFRRRASVFSEEQIRCFTELAKVRDDLRGSGIDFVGSRIRTIIRREGLLAWKGLLESQRPQLLTKKPEFTRKIDLLRSSLQRLKEIDQELLKNNLAEGHISPATRWEGITRLRGPRKVSLREFFESGTPLGLRTLRPVWLMIPDVVSQIFPRVAGLFDVVVFDEASQMPVEHSLPSLFRARTVVVSGDEKQMPPSSFFSSRMESDESDVEDDTLSDEEMSEQERDAQEQAWNRREIKDCPDLLHLAEAILPRAMLQIHYRSRYRELISFSNAAYYRNELSVPVIHPDRTILADKPLEYIHVNGIYEKQTNETEAKQVIAYLESIWKLPAEGRPSIGVVTFNRKQADLIDDLLEARAEKNAKFRDALIAERSRRDNGEDMSFFVKNVENVQGDERDLIVFSTTFGRSSQGTFRRSFGVLGQGGGERRLNVAITRARTRVAIVTSMPVQEVSDMLSLQRAPISPRDYLQGYLEYARLMSSGNLEKGRRLVSRMSTGRRSEPETTRRLNGFQSSVFRYLSSLGYQICQPEADPVLGIDFAIIDPHTGLFGVGIECELPTHKLLSTARAREIWRPSVIAATYRAFVRVSASEWFQDRAAEELRILREIRSVIGENP